ncbi:MAG: efflux RND transporter periplasmic adaptor subunit [Pyrinomonadaceae bacterium]
MKTKIALIPAAMMLAFFAAGCSKEKTPDTYIPAASEVRNVMIVKVSHSSIEDFYEATGTVKAKTTTQVSANMLGRIVSFSAAEGDTVSRGQVLVEIDNSESKAQLAKAQAGLKEAQASLVEVARSVDSANAGVRTADANKQLAEKTFARYKELYERRSASAQEFDEAQSRLSASTSELERARANVQTILSKNKQINARIEQAKAEIANTQVYAGYSKIVSPVSGIVVKKFAEAGATAAPGTPLLSVEDISQYRLEAAVEESRSQSIRVGGRVSVRIDALGDGEFLANIAEIMPTSDAASRSYTIKIDLPANPALRTGLYGLARFPVAQKDAITVPQTAIVQRGQLSGVYVVGGEGKVQFRIVTTGKTSEGMTEVLSGVSEGDEIANSEIEKLNDGTKVR